MIGSNNNSSSNNSSSNKNHKHDTADSSSNNSDSNHYSCSNEENKINSDKSSEKKAFLTKKLNHVIKSYITTFDVVKSACEFGRILVFENFVWQKMLYIKLCIRTYSGLDTQFFKCFSSLDTMP